MVAVADAARRIVEAHVVHADLRARHGGGERAQRERREVERGGGPQADAQAAGASGGRVLDLLHGRGDAVEQRPGRSSSASPAGVSATRRVVRSTSCTPMRSSSWRIWTESAGWARCRRSAARVKLRSSATATNDRRCSDLDVHRAAQLRTIAIHDHSGRGSLFHFPAPRRARSGHDNHHHPRGPELFAGSRFTWHLTADQTAGQASLADVLVRPGAEPPVHVHAREDEAYVVLEGEVTSCAAPRRSRPAPASAVFLPRGLQHGFAVRTPLARLMVLLHPRWARAGIRDWRVPTELDIPLPPTGPPSDEEAEALAAAFADSGVTFVGPPLPVLLAQQAG